MGLRVLPPDINASAYPYSGKEKDLRVGLMQIQGLNRHAAERLLKERDRQGDYRSFADFLKRMNIHAADATLLVKAGCFDSLEGMERRPALLWEVLAFQGEKTSPGNGSLFEAAGPALPSPTPYDRQTVLRQELETLGLLLSCHPLELYRDGLRRLQPVPARDLGRWTGRRITLVGWWVTGKTVQDKNGRPMEFVSFEDTTAIFDVTFFPKVYARFCQMLSRLKPYVLRGRVEEEFGVATLNAESLEFLG